MVGAAAKLTLEGGVVKEARIALTGAGDFAFRAKGVEAALRGVNVSDVERLSGRPALGHQPGPISAPINYAPAALPFAAMYATSSPAGPWRRPRRANHSFVKVA